LFDEAPEAARAAATPLRDAGLEAQAEMLLTRATGTRDRRPFAWTKTFDNPVFWGAFQLVGRIA
jgi:hypothetical protein